MVAVLGLCIFALALAPSLERVLPGGVLAFMSERGGKYVIKLVDTVSGETLPLTRSHWDSVQPVWSTDGLRIVSAADTAGDLTYSLFVTNASMNARAAETLLLRAQGTESYIWPELSPDGRHIIFQSNRRVIYSPYAVRRTGCN
jgi:Tol biopolymer transport system component